MSQKQSKSATPVIERISQQAIGIIQINYPPVNALSQKVRQGLVDAMDYFNQDDSVKAILIRCIGRTFIAGADIKEFGKPPLEPHLPQVLNHIEASKKPVFAALFGTTLGGGFELALACQYRIAKAGSKVGLPEVKLGLIPGAGGTQRLPRLLPLSGALQMITSGKPCAVEELHQSPSDHSEARLFSAIIDSQQDFDQACIDFIQKKIKQDQIECIPSRSLQVQDDIDDWQATLQRVKAKARGVEAPLVAAQVMQQGKNLPFDKAMATERAAFIGRRDSEQSAALRYMFSAERQAAKFLGDSQPVEVTEVGIIGGGTMGAGIAVAFLSCGFKLVLIEQNQQALHAAKDRIESTFSGNIKSGRMSQSQVDNCLQQLTLAIDYATLSDCQLVIEAVFEKMSVKKAIFSQLQERCSVECIFASNTSYLDINEIAASIRRPQQVIGMHFFSPANIMKLLEVVRAKQSSDQAIATAFAVAKKLNKVAVEVSVCFGFAGNRMYTRYGREVQQMLLEGATVEQIDKALTGWGMAMGPLAVADMSGLDIGYHARSSQPFPEHDQGYFKPAELLYKKGRYGRKTEAGYYLYPQGKVQVDPQVDQWISQLAESLAIKQRKFEHQEIVERALYALINEGLQLLQDGIVKRASDIDVIWNYGYGFPRYKGGPMFQAKRLGRDKIGQSFSDWRQQQGEKIWPEVDFSLLDN